MSKITLPTNIFLELNEAEEIEVKKEIEALTNRTIEEINHISTNYVDDIELINYYQNQSNYFSNLSKFLFVFEEEDAIFKKIEEFNELRNLQRDYVNLADGIANVFEEFKCNLKPSMDLSMALKMNDPSFPISKKENFGDLDYEEINRLIKIYLLKENLENVEHEVENGILIIKSKHFTLKLTLCGEINNPQWKIFDISKENKVQYLIELPSSIKSLVSLIKIYEGKEECKEIYNSLIKDNYFAKFLKGSKFDFEFDFILPLKVKITKKGISGAVFSGNKKKIFSGEILKNYENEVKKLLKEIDGRANFTIKNKITLQNKEQSFSSILELNEFLYNEREEKCFYSFFEKFRIKKNFMKEKFGGKNVCLLFSGCIFVFKLEKLDFNSENYLESTIFVKIFAMKSFENGITIPEEMFFGVEDMEIFVCTEKIEENFSLKVKDFAKFVSNFDFSQISYSFLVENKKMKIFEKEIKIEEKNLKITKNENYFMINDKFLLNDLKNLKDFLVFSNTVTELTKRKIVYAEENGIFWCKFKGLEFQITFRNEIIVKSKKKAAIFYLSRRNLLFFLDNFYYFIMNEIFPSYVCDNFVIFDFLDSFETLVSFKAEKKDKLRILKNKFTEKNFSLRENNLVYYFLDPSDKIFFDKFRSFYYKDRFTKLANELKKYFTVHFKDFRMEIIGRDKINISLENDKIKIDAENKAIHENEKILMENSFYRDEEFSINFVKLIQKY